MNTNYLLIILGMAVVTYATRVGFIGVARQFELHPLLLRSLEYVPVAILAAIIFPSALAPSQKIAMPLTNVYVWTLVVTGIVLTATRRPWLAIVLGTASLVVMRSFL